jgi:hypothetical protein
LARHPRDIECNFNLAKMRERCIADGGTYQPLGLSRSYGCIRPTRDGGKACRSRADCEVACLYSGGSPPSGMEAAGQCAPDNNRLGCKSFVENGRVVVGPCVD